ncbi:kinase-like domain-containing protein [Hyaloraphidium curvatum]|nr:kinase-like domain-containing protein [Hyaloraphidium curvatum]
MSLIGRKTHFARDPSGRGVIRALESRALFSLPWSKINKGLRLVAVGSAASVEAWFGVLPFGTSLAPHEGSAQHPFPAGSALRRGIQANPADMLSLSNSQQRTADHIFRRSRRSPGPYSRPHSPAMPRADHSTRTSPALPAEGTLLRGAAAVWRIGRPLGKGSFATVFEARGPNGERAVVKSAAPSPQVDREAEALRKLAGHPNVVRLLDVARTPAATHLVLERVDGLELYDFLQAQPAGRMREDLARAVATQLLDALAHCASRGVLHRDCKLDNVLVSADGRVVLIDFNLCASFTDATSHTDPVGSIRYCAPTVLELAAAGLPYPADGGWVDVYSAAVVAYACLTGCWPFRGDSPEEALEDYLAAFDARGGFGRGIEFPEDVSEQARAFVLAGLDSRYRFRADEMRAHPWLAEAPPSPSETLVGSEAGSPFALDDFVDAEALADSANGMQLWNSASPAAPSAPPLDLCTAAPEDDGEDTDCEDAWGGELAAVLLSISAC